MSPLPSWQRMHDWYQPYIDISSQRSCIFSDGAGGASEVWTTHITRGEIEWKGLAVRYKRMGGTEVANSSFKIYAQKMGVPDTLFNGYRKIEKTMAAGFKSVAKYDVNPFPAMDEPAFAIAKEWTIRHFIPHLSHSSVLGQEQVIGELNKATSCGYPWNLRFKSKREFFADDKATMVLTVKWDQLGCDNVEDMPCLWSVSQKDELRTTEKVLARKHRTFMVSPIEHTVSLARLCMDMNERFYASAMKTWSFVGKSKFRGGWQDLYHYLCQHPNGFELDEKNYDSSLCSFLMHFMVEFRWAMLKHEDRTPDNRLRLEKLYYDIIHSVIVMENGELGQKHTGNPSGSGNTTVDNTVLLFLLLCYAWVLILRRQWDLLAECYDFGSYRDFMDNVAAILNGDDNSWSGSNRIVTYFNPKTIKEVWGGIGVTTETPCETPRPIMQLKFLSQGFALVNRRILPRPDTDKVLGSLMYGSDCDDVRWHLLRANALRLDSWGNLECRQILDGYILWLMREYHSRMVGTTHDIPVKHILDLYRSDDWCRRLYTARESGDDVELQRGGLENETSLKDSPSFKTQQHLVKQCLIIFPRKFPLFVSTMPRNDKQRAARAARRKKSRAKQALQATSNMFTRKVLSANTRRKYNRTMNKQGMQGPTNMPEAFRPIAGHGDYKDVLKSFGKMGLESGGEALGSLIHPGLGSIGRSAGSWLSKIFGFGAYHVKKNSLMQTNSAPVGMSVPEFATGKFPGSIVVAHREFVGDITSHVDFTNQNYLIHVGNTSLWPWLANISLNFEEAEILGCVFEFKSMSATAVGSTNTGLGTVIMATDYDVVDSNYATKQQMEICEFANSAAPCYSQIHPIECDPKQTVMPKTFIQYGVTRASDFPDDPRFSCMGNFQIASSGVQAASNVGELWVSYHVRLMKPQLPTSLLGNAVYTGHWNYGVLSSGGISTNLVSQLPLPGNQFSWESASGTSPTLTLIGGAVLTGRFMLVVIWNDPGAGLPTDSGFTASFTGTWQNVFISTDGTLPFNQTNASSQQVYTSTSAAMYTASSISYCIFDAPGPGTLVLPVCYDSLNSSAADMFLVQVNSSLTTPFTRLSRPNVNSVDSRLKEVERLLASLKGMNQTLAHSVRPTPPSASGAASSSEPEAYSNSELPCSAVETDDDYVRPTPPNTTSCSSREAFSVNDEGRTRSIASALKALPAALTLGRK